MVEHGIYVVLNGRNDLDGNLVKFGEGTILGVIWIFCNVIL